MCGISAIISFDGKSDNADLKKMTDAIKHRGPDGDGLWISKDAKVCLGHRRLSIIDLTTEADQPMIYDDRYVIIFNGEIYNYLELKKALIQKGYKFQTNSDTEVVLASYKDKREKCLEDFDGMFAMVIYDQQTQEIFAARDRFGEKPFFYTIHKGKLYISSEMKSFWAMGIPKTMNKKMIFNYLNTGLVYNPRDLSETFFENVFKLKAAHYFRIGINDPNASDIKQIKYWDLDYNPTFNGTLEDAKFMFDKLMKESIQRRLRSDVPVGSSLSGGLDSSLVVSLISELHGDRSSFRQNTFSAQFPGFSKDETYFQNLIINKLPIQSYTVQPTDQDLIDDFDKLIYHQEEPFGSASIYVQYEVMKLAKQKNVTVLLDGQGADEILAGYYTYYFIHLSQTLKNNPTKFWKEYKKFNENHGNIYSLSSVASMIFRKNIESIFPSSIQKIKDRNNFKNKTFNKNLISTYADQVHHSTLHFNNLNRALYTSTVGGDLETLLRFADRNSMAHSREVRLPFLSHELVEFLYTLPPTFKIHDGWSKWLMRETYANLLPEEIVWRKEKVGYEPPQKAWMQNKELQNRMIENKNQLIDLGILHSDVADFHNNDATSGNRLGWQVLSLGGVLE